MREASPEEPGGAAAGGAAGPAPPRKGKSCKGGLFYSSALKSRGYNPVCLGIPRSIQVPSYGVSEDKEKATAEATAEGLEFRYLCVGASKFVDNTNGQGSESEGKTPLPFCRGLEVLQARPLAEGKPSTAELGQAHVSKDAATPTRSRQPGHHAPGPLGRQDFLARFQRSAGLVASGVAKNLNRTANYIKGSIQDIIYPDRRSPK